MDVLADEVLSEGAEKFAAMAKVTVPILCTFPVIASRENSRGQSDRYGTHGVAFSTTRMAGGK